MTKYAMTTVHLGTAHGNMPIPLRPPDENPGWILIEQSQSYIGNEIIIVLTWCYDDE